MSKQRIRYHIMLGPEDIEPSRDDLEVVGVFNAGACRFKDGYLLLIRVAETQKDRNDKLRYSPRMDFSGDEPKIVVDSYRLGVECGQDEPRCIPLTRGGVRLTSLSHLRLAWSPDGRIIDKGSISNGPVIPFSSSEEYGQEDARIVPMSDLPPKPQEIEDKDHYIEGKYIISSVAVSRNGIVSVFRKTDDFETFSDPWAVMPGCKDTLPFPEKINSDYCMLNKPPTGLSGKPNINISFSKDLADWGRHRILMGCSEKGFDSNGIGGSAPPLKTKNGWVEIYHGTKKRGIGDTPLKVYQCGAAIIDFDTLRVIARSREPFIKPHTATLTGPNGHTTFCPDTAFVSGAYIEDGGDRPENQTLRNFGGFDDEYVFSAEVPMDRVYGSMEYLDRKCMVSV